MDLFRLVSYCISHICMMGFLMAFSRLRYSWGKTLGILSGSALTLIFLEVLRYCGPGSSKVYFLVTGLQILAVQAPAMLISDFRGFRALFTGFSSSNYVLPGTITGIYLYILTGKPLLALAVEILLHLVTLWFLISALRPLYLEIQTKRQNSWMSMCLMPALLYVSAMGLDLAVKGSDKPMTALFTMLSFLLTVYASYLLVFHVIQKLNQEQRILGEREILHASIRALKREQEEIRASEHKIAVHIHDNRHMLRMMQQLMAEGDYDGVNQMLGQMEDITEVRQPKHYSDIVAVNGVLSYYAAAAEKKGILLDVQMELPEDFANRHVNEWGLAVVLGNLMDNAIRSCGAVSCAADRGIRVRARQVKGQVLIEMWNRFEGQLSFDPKSGLPVSHRGEGHGVGLRSVAYFAEKNQAAFDCGVEEGEFVARILI